MHRGLQRLTTALALLVPASAGAADLALKRVVLSSGGVGYFEYAATVDGDAGLTLDVPLDQVDDVLKSLIVYDKAGSAGEITLPGRDPLSHGFADLPFDQAALASVTVLLNALQGAEVRLAADKPVTGRLIHAADDSVRSADGATQTRTRITLLTDAGLQQVLLRDFEDLAFIDAKLQEQLASALNRIAAYRAPGRRTLALSLHGSGQREVRVGYVVGMPLWKASYRVMLPADPKAPAARVQGWAVLENFSGQAWQDVDLTLLSGNPVTFRQALYESYYVPRTSVPVEAGGRVLPPPDTGVLAGKPESRADEDARGRAKSAQTRALAQGAMAVPAPAPPPPPPASIEQAAAVDEATQIAFTPPYKISVAAGQSLVLPLIDRELPARRVDLYQPGTDPVRPLAAIELKNAGDSGLPPGVLTLYQAGERGTTYLGDARLAAFPAGETRLLSYAVDNKVTIAVDVKSQQVIAKATIAEGVMRLTKVDRSTSITTVTAAAPPPRLVIDLPKPTTGAELVEPTTAERTANGYRIPVALDEKGSGRVTVVFERPLRQEFRLVDLSDDQLGVYVSGRELDPKLHDALAGLAQRRQAAGRLKREIDRLNGERAKLVEDEARLRENYTALKDEPGMRKRTLDKLNEAMSALDANAAAVAKTSAALTTAQTELAGYIAGLKL